MTIPPALDPAVTSKPILFSGEMVRAILNGSKTQTRRVITDRNSQGNYRASQMDLSRAWVDGGFSDFRYLKSYLQPAVAEKNGEEPDAIVERLFCRFEPGQRLWVKETFFDHGDIQGSRPLPLDLRIEYRAEEWHRDSDEDAGPWTPSIYMPRAFSRITLEITNVRVQRVQEISAKDAEAEGVFRHIAEYSINKVFRDERGPTALKYFRELWDSINAKRGYSWESNPWVWCLTFKRLDQSECAA